MIGFVCCLISPICKLDGVKVISCNSLGLSGKQWQVSIEHYMYAWYGIAISTHVR